MSKLRPNLDINTFLGSSSTSQVIDNVAQAKGKLKTLPFALIRPNPYQPRKNYTQEAIIDLANSIIENKGLIQPVVVREEEEGYSLACGERRLRAYRYINDTLHLDDFEEIMAITYRSLTEEQMLRIALVENVQREDLTPYELAQAYSSWHYNNDGKVLYSVSDIAKMVGKSSSYVDDCLKILDAPKEVQQLMQNNPDIPPRVGRELAQVKEQEVLHQLVEEIQQPGAKISTKEVRALVKDVKQQKPEIPRNIAFQKRMASLDKRIKILIEEEKNQAYTDIELQMAKQYYEQWFTYFSDLNEK